MPKQEWVPANKLEEGMRFTAWRFNDCEPFHHHGIVDVCKKSGKMIVVFDEPADKVDIRSVKSVNHWEFLV